jgi:hypothetical protein
MRCLDMYDMLGTSQNTTRFFNLDVQSSPSHFRLRSLPSAPPARSIRASINFNDIVRDVIGATTAQIQNKPGKVLG